MQQPRQRKSMRHFYFIAIAACSMAFAVNAQNTTNAPNTEIELFEAQTGRVIVKGFSDIGSVNTGSGVVTIRCKESTDATNGRKLYGVAIRFAGNNRFSEKLVVDYSELDSLASSIDYLGKITYDVTSLPGFEATYSTRSGLRIVAYSSRRQGGIQTFLQFGDNPRVLLTTDQMTQLEGLIGQAKTMIDSLRTAK
jgi:hypothetical protein